MKQVGKHHVPAPYAPNKALQVRLYLAHALTVNFPAFAPGGPIKLMVCLRWSLRFVQRKKFLQYYRKAN